ncbi:MAG: hypothetical protein ACO1RX_16935 [Candidatus Sericytochromatia bacterium]
MFKFPLVSLGVLALSLNVSLPVSAESEAYSYPDLRFRLSDPNPASYGWDGSGRLQLPSLRFEMGSSLNLQEITREVTGISAIFANPALESDAITAQNNQLTTSVGVLLSQFREQTRSDYELDLNLFSFSGSPFASVQLAGRPLSFGLHLGAETRSYLNLNMRSDFRQDLVEVGAVLPDVLSANRQITEVSQQAGTLVQELNALTAEIDALAENANRFFSSPSQAGLNELTGRLEDVNSGIDALLPDARRLTQAVSTSATGADGLITAFGQLSEEGIQLTTANDVHLTLGMGAAYPLYQSPDITVSLGGQLKLFVLPYNIPLSSLGINSSLGLLGKLELNQITGLGELPLLSESVDRLQTAVTDVNTVISRAETLSDTVGQVTDALTARDLNALSSSGNQLVRDGLAFNQGVSGAQGSVQQAAVAVGDLPNTLLRELNTVRMKGSLTTPDSVGAGLDLGLDAIFYRHLRLGLQIQNPLVFWQGTERPFEATLVRTQSGSTVFQPTLTPTEGEAKRVGYNATVPLAVLLTGQYRFDELLPAFPGLTANSLMEFVANGRTPGWTLGLQKSLGTLGYVGLGGRMGGISSMLYLETGLRPIQGLGLDLQLGISPVGNGVPAPGLDWLSLGRVALNWQF